MSYINCPQCDQKALSVATRCPRCGVAFEPQVIHTPNPRRGRHPLALLLGAAALLLIVMQAAQRNFGVAPRPLHPALSEGEVPPPPKPKATPSPSRPARAAPAPVPAAQIAVAESAPSTPKAAVPTKDTTVAGLELEGTSPQTEPAEVSPPVASDSGTDDSASTEPTKRRYASTWLNIRARRSSSAPVVRVLKPGEPVLVDVLQEGWYRVVGNEQAVGFVDRRLLDSSPPVTPEARQDRRPLKYPLQPISPVPRLISYLASYT